MVKSPRFVDYVFWVTLILYTDPGRILSAFGESSGDGGINITDLLFVVMVVCYISVLIRNDGIVDKSFNQLTKYLILFLIYYIVVFAFFVPIFKNSPNYSPVSTFVKIRHGIINFSSIFLVYKFYSRSSSLFFKVFMISSIIIMILLIVNIVTGIEILPVERMTRRFTTTERIVLGNYGIMHMLIPMGAVALIFKFKIKAKKLIILGFVLMFMVWIFAIFRRNIIGTFLIFILTAIILNFIKKKPLIPISKILTILVYAISLFVFISFTFPKYAEATVAGMKEVVHVIQYGESTSGIADTRLGFGKKFMQDLIKNNYLFGTGFDNRWRLKEGDTQGYEASDYPFLASIAMGGIIGILFFLPIYVVLVRTIIYDLKFLRINNFESESINDFFLLVFLIFFTYEFLLYNDWFKPFSMFSHIAFKRWFIYLGFYFASRKLFYTSRMKVNRNVSK